VGMVFQNPDNQIVANVVEEDVAFGPENLGVASPMIRKRVDHALKQVGMYEYREHAPHLLSGGQKQRIAIARALSTKPDILFCDEATSALDPQTTRSILNLIRQIQKKMNLTVVMITHQMEVVRDACDEVAVVDAGKIVEQGKVAEIFSTPKSEVTKEFLSHLTPSSSKGNEEFARWSKEGGEYSLYFEGSKTSEPVLSRLAKNFNVEFNIRAGGIARLAEGEVGKMILDFAGSIEEIEKAISYLKENGIRVEEEK
ncbi:MAG: methionine ABC transporter ATP-binding protein, partial [Treponema sp.]|nr:methionine ABC transporter ATP-binding protein [Treponema sp.]